MNSYLLNRELGTVSPKALQQAETRRLLLALQAAPDIKFDGTDAATAGPSQSHAGQVTGGRDGVWAHKAGVNCIAVDKFEGRYMLSGGAESSIKLWDLESAESTLKRFTYRPAGAVQKYSSLRSCNTNEAEPPSDPLRPISLVSRTCPFTHSTHLPSSPHPTTIASRSTPLKP